jgi:hypothetical protein
MDGADERLPDGPPTRPLRSTLPYRIFIDGERMFAYNWGKDIVQ